MHTKPVLPLPERAVRSFWNKVERRAVSDCWPWRSTKTAKGYGKLGVNGRGGGGILAHRVAWAIAHGDDPGTLCVLHRCDNPPCVNPSHLFLGTVRDNNHDCRAKGRSKFPKQPETTCRHGHAITPSNTTTDYRGFRRCRECGRLKEQRRRQKAKERRNAS